MTDPTISDPEVAEDEAGEDTPLSAYEKAGAEDIDPRCVPQTLDGPPPVGDEIVTPDYSDEDNANWTFLFNRQMSMLPGRAGDAFVSGVETLGMTPDGIPAHPDLSQRIGVGRRCPDG